MTISQSKLSSLAVLYPLWQWLVFVPIAALVTVVFALLAIVLALLVSPRVANLYIGVPWGRILTRLALVRVDLEGAEQIDSSQSYVVVANHQSQFDIPVIYGYSGLDLRWVAKAEVGKIPFVAAGCRAIGHIFIDRSNPDQSRDAINRAVARLKAGTGLLFFAEGTRSRTGKLLPFKKGAFRVAIEQQLPVLPVTVINTREVLPSGSLRIRPGRVRMVVHSPIETQGMESGEHRDLRARVHTTIAKALNTEAMS